MVCVACSADVPDEDVFCENCGVKLKTGSTPVSSCTCGAEPEELDEDGFCLCCGRRVRRPASDHIELSLSPDFAGVSDRGLRHDRNEDRFALVQAETGYGLVLCDGVSATRDAEIASAVVSETVARCLGETLQHGEVADPDRATTEAIAAGVTELKARSGPDGEDETPSTTVVAALVIGRELTIAWVGDSRAYWVDEHGAVQLTHDHSWVNLVVGSGEMTEEQALNAPQAHAITRWLGADADEVSTPEVVHYHAEISGTLLLCTDGLWNYTITPETLAQRLQEQQGSDALSTAQALVTYAKEQGGRDNITVAVLRLPLPSATPGD